MKKADLEKENAELKQKVATLNLIVDTYKFVIREIGKRKYSGPRYVAPGIRDE